MTEDELLSAILELAKFAGFRRCHFRPARTAKGWRTAVQGDPGFPDLILVGHKRFICAELKSNEGALSRSQIAWIEQILDTKVEWYLWSPSDWIDGMIAKALGCEGGVISEAAACGSRG